MEKKLIIPIGNKKIVVEIDDMCIPELVPAFCVYITDEDDCPVQDICLVRPHERFDEQEHKFETSSDLVDCLVWSDPNDSDYTHKFTIGMYEEEEF